MEAEIGIIGGSGFYSMLENAEKIEVETDYGRPSGTISVGEIKGRKVAFLSRHGAKHSIPPHKVPFRANIEALHKIGVKQILVTSALGSLKLDYKPGDFVFFDQFVNMTHGREETFFDRDLVMHVSAADPYCPTLRRIGIDGAKKLGLRHHEKGTVVVVNGPRFSTRAESRFFGDQGFDVINMTQYPEMMLARERCICYLGIGIVTDYDVGLSGHPDVKPVSHSQVMSVFTNNIFKAKNLFVEIIENLPKERRCTCENALEGARASL